LQLGVADEILVQVHAIGVAKPMGIFYYGTASEFDKR
jgi:hypothetical protein